MKRNSSDQGSSKIPLNYNANRTKKPVKKIERHGDDVYLLIRHREVHRNNMTKNGDGTIMLTAK